jgi:hypothetical protein
MSDSLLPSRTRSDPMKKVKLAQMLVINRREGSYVESSAVELDELGAQGQSDSCMNERTTQGSSHEQDLTSVTGEKETDGSDADPPVPSCDLEIDATRWNLSVTLEMSAFGIPTPVSVMETSASSGW